MATEKRLIDANELRAQFGDIPPFIGVTGGCVQQYIDKAPTVDAVEVVHGHWIDPPSMKGQVYCSECATIEKSTDSNYKSKRCPNCGAKMDLEEGAN